MAGYLSKYHIGLDSKGYVLNKRDGKPYYDKKRAPTFVNKFGSGDSSYRDSTFWQFWATTNWRNGAKQLRLDDPGKFWNSENLDVTQLDKLTLSRNLSYVGQTAVGTKINAIEAWRNSVNWWNSNYGYRQQITITAPVSQQIPQYNPIKITIDTAALESGSKVRSDRKDWRVLYFNGSTWVDLTRHYVSTTSTLFALQAAIPAGSSDSNYYVYYGYSGESTTKQPSTEADFNSVYGMYGLTPDANSLGVYHFREGSGTSVNDDSGNVSNGNFQSPGWVTTGKYGYEGDFNSSTVIISPGMTLGSMTLEGFFNFDSASGTQQLINRMVAAATVGYELKLTGGKITFSVQDTLTVVTTVTSTTSIVAGTTYHIAAVHDGTSMKIYINGTLEASATASTPVSQDNDTVLGRLANGSTSQDYNGKMSHVRISNTARTSFPYALTSDPSVAYGTETTTQPPTSSFDTYVGNSNGKIYKISGSTITEEFDTRRITWYETGTDTAHKIGDEGGTERAQAQSFQIGGTAVNIKAVELYLLKASGTPGDITVRIETDNAGVPSGTLANASLTTTIPAFTTASYAWKTAEFPASVTLSASTTYWLVAKVAAQPNDTYYNLAVDASSPTYTAGNMANSADGGATWTADTGRDVYFRILGDSTSVNDLLVTSLGGTRKMLIATGDISSQTNGNAKLYTYDGTTYVLAKIFATTTESQITALEEYNGKLYAGVGPQAKIYEGTNPTSWTLSKDIDVPQAPGYVYALKEYNGLLYAGGGSPEFLYDKHYNGFWYRFDGTTWSSLYPFSFTELRSFEFYDAFLFGSTYHGQTYVYDTATLNPLFSFKDGFNYRQTVYCAQLYDDKIYFGLYPQEGTNDTNVGVWVFDRHGFSLAYKISGVTGYRCMGVVNNILVIGTGDDGKVYQLDLNNFTTQGYVQTSYFDANLPSIDKLYNAVTIQHAPLESGQSVKVYYRFKESDSWTLLGTSNTVDATSATLSFPSQTYSKKISLKVELNTSDTAQAPEVTEYVLQYTLYPSVKWLWTVRILVKKNIKLQDNTLESRSATQIRSDLEGLISANKLISFVDVDGTTYNVLPTDLDQTSWVINQNDVNENELALTLLEA